MTKISTISQAITNIQKEFGSIDVLCNNAWYGLTGSFEAMTSEQIEKEFDVNVFGVMNMIREILPIFRKQKSWTIITVTFMAGVFTIPTYSVYHATKWSLEWFLESLQYELRQFGIKIKIIQPWIIKTNFYDKSMDISHKDWLKDYDNYVNIVNKNISKGTKNASWPQVVAKKIYNAVNDNSNRMRYSVWGNWPLLIFLRKIIPTRIFNKLISIFLEKNT